MAKAPSPESSPKLSGHFSAMSLEERELKARKEIEAMELEEQVANLEAKRDAMKRMHYNCVCMCIYTYTYIYT